MALFDVTWRFLAFSGVLLAFFRRFWRLSALSDNFSRFSTFIEFSGVLFQTVPTLTRLALKSVLPADSRKNSSTQKTDTNANVPRSKKTFTETATSGNQVLSPSKLNTTAPTTETTDEKKANTFKTASALSTLDFHDWISWETWENVVNPRFSCGKLWAC